MHGTHARCCELADWHGLDELTNVWPIDTDVLPFDVAPELVMLETENFLNGIHSQSSICLPHLTSIKPT